MLLDKFAFLILLRKIKTRRATRSQICTSIIASFFLLYFASVKIEVFKTFKCLFINLAYTVLTHTPIFHKPSLYSTNTYSNIP